MKHPGLTNIVKEDSNEVFEWSEDSFIKAKKIITNYPTGREQSAVLPLLDLAQKHNKGWLSKNAIEKVAETLSMPYIRVLEVATFYSMFNKFNHIIIRYFWMVLHPPYFRLSNFKLNVHKFIYFVAR